MQRGDPTGFSPIESFLGHARLIWPPRKWQSLLAVNISDEGRRERKYREGGGGGKLGNGAHVHTDLPAYSDTLRTGHGQKCHCNMMAL